MITKLKKRILFAAALNENEMAIVLEKMEEEGYTNKSKYIRSKVGLE